MNAIFSIAFDASVRAIPAAAAVGMILSALRVRSATARHAAWTAVAIAMLLMPVMPKLPVPSVLSTTRAISQPEAPLPDFAAPATPFTPQAAPSAPLSIPAPGPLPAPHPLPWTSIIFALYLAGLLALLARLAIGWWGAHALIRSAQRVAVPSGGIPVFESSAIAAPLTAGVFRPRILLPEVWRLWPADKLRAVLVHESAHVHRRDGMIFLLAQMNRCFFWFHPLAWWLERQILATAEQAADEAAVATTGAPRAYAQILIEMADEVRRRGGLHAAPAFMSGGSLERHIDSILSARQSVPMSRRRKAVVVFACTISLFVAACGQQANSRAARAEARRKLDTEREASWKAAGDFASAAQRMSADEVAALEAGLQTSPDNLNARKKLLAYYGGKLSTAVKQTPLDPETGRTGSGRQTAQSNSAAAQLSSVPKQMPRTEIDQDAAKAVIAAALPHYFWLIEHHPDDDFLRSDGRFTAPHPFSSMALGIPGIFYSPFDRNPNPQNVERARKIWLAHAEQNNLSPIACLNAFDFFRNVDKPLAEKMLLKGRAADPGNEASPRSWTGTLGQFYAQVLTTRMFAQPMLSRLGPVSSAYAAEVRHRLETSNDPQVLLATASSLVGLGVPPAADLDLGDALIKRAQTIQPDSTWARQLQVTAADARTTVALPEAIRFGALDSRRAAIEQLPPGERFRELVNIAILAGDQSMRSRYQHDEPAAKTAWQRAAMYANEALQLAPAAINHPDYGTALFKANMVLGLAAIEAGDSKSAAAYLLKAADSPVTDALRYPITNARPWPTFGSLPSTLEAALLKAGERDAVIAFLKRYSEITVSDRQRALDDLAAIQQGKPPSFVRS